MPRATSATSKYSFQNNWKQWHTECEAQAASENIYDCREVADLFRLLSGDLDVVCELEEESIPWYERLISEIFLQVSPTYLWFPSYLAHLLHFRGKYFYRNI
tara:strand:+ start:1465 stop:1770 length:306 start_codon:yes stop_codon:yes gene_type:complete